MPCLSGAKEATGGGTAEERLLMTRWESEGREIGPDVPSLLRDVGIYDVLQARVHDKYQVTRCIAQQLS